jgi:hypothetical protein
LDKGVIPERGNRSLRESVIPRIFLGGVFFEGVAEFGWFDYFHVRRPLRILPSSSGLIATVIVNSSRPSSAVPNCSVLCQK